MNIHADVEQGMAEEHLLQEDSNGRGTSSARRIEHLPEGQVADHEEHLNALLQVLCRRCQENRENERERRERELCR